MTSHRVVTLLTDFGTDSPYVAQMCGVLHSRIDNLQITHLTHAVPPQDIDCGAMLLEDLVGWFPAGTVHIAVVDPGVGTSRRILAGRLGSGFIVLPDNGLVTFAAKRFGFSEVVALLPTSHWLQPTSNTFHGRDIMAPVAAAIARGVSLGELGERVSGWRELNLSEATWQEDHWAVQIVYVDSFGNLITNLRQEQVAPGTLRSVKIGTVEIRHFVETYAEVKAKEMVGLFGSLGRFEIAVSGGNAAESLQLGRGANLCVFGERSEKLRS